VTLEALSSGLPVVAANATGSNALVDDGVNGFLAPPGISAAFAEKVERLVLDAGLRTEMAGKARASAEAYDWSRVLAQMVTYYERAF
jgi:glycosyltransferase involved in cell wall biosynthesis